MTAIPACMIGIIIGGFMGAIIGASDWPMNQMRRRIKRDRARMRQMAVEHRMEVWMLRQQIEQMKER